MFPIDRRGADDLEVISLGVETLQEIEDAVDMVWAEFFEIPKGGGYITYDFIHEIIARAGHEQKNKNLWSSIESEEARSELDYLIGQDICDVQPHSLVSQEQRHEICDALFALLPSQGRWFKNYEVSDLGYRWSGSDFSRATFECALLFVGKTSSFLLMFLAED